MEDIIHIRIDDRLLHGQVVTFWSHSLNATRLMVVNDAVANDEMQKSILKMVVPSGMRVSIITKEKAATNILAKRYHGQRVMMILKNPKDVLDLMDLGLDIKEVNVGNMSTRDNTTQIKKSISLTEKEFEEFDELEKKGVVVTSIMVPDNPKSYLRDFINKSNKKH